MKIRRIYRIVSVIRRYGLLTIASDSIEKPWIKWTLKVLAGGGTVVDASRGERIRRALEDLGPIFVKLGQLLSTRRDLLPEDIADELTKLQDQVPPFDSATASALIESSLGRKIDDMFTEFQFDPVASASIAQVHFAKVKTGPHAGKDVAIKVLRPEMNTIIAKDLELMKMAAGWLEKVSSDGKRLKPREVVAEFDKYLNDELDLMREAANASQLRRNFSAATGSGHLLKVPEMYWEYCSRDVITMERMRGIPISQIQRLKENHIDLKKLSRDGGPRGVEAGAVDRQVLADEDAVRIVPPDAAVEKPESRAVGRADVSAGIGADPHRVEQAELDASDVRTEADLTRTRLIMTIIGVVALLGSGGLAVWLSLVVTRGLSKVAGVARAVRRMPTAPSPLPLACPSPRPLPR